MASKNPIEAVKATNIYSKEEYYYQTDTRMVDAMGWDGQQFRNHKSRQSNKSKFVYKKFVIEGITII